MQSVKNFDPDLFSLLQKEEKRQFENIELIASENIVSKAVLEMQGSILTNKYAEGFPGKRYYGGCEFVDEIENLAIERVKKLFNCNFANVQPHSGSQANFAVYLCELKPGDTVLGMSLAEGGHLTHGSPVNFSGKLFNIVSYGINKETGFIDYEEVYEKAQTHKPKMIICGASAYPRLIDFAKFREIADSVGAVLMADIAHIAGLVATGLHPSPLPYADYVTSTTHKTLRGPRGGLILTNNEEKAKKMNSSIFPGSQGGPLMHVIAGKAVCFKEALEPSFKEYQQKVLSNAKILAEELVKHNFDIISGGTENHLMLVSLVKKGVTGKELEKALDTVHITLNKNSIPKDPESPFITSGIRIGTPAVTTRHMGEQEMKQIASFINTVCENIKNPEKYAFVGEKVIQLTKKFPLSYLRS